MRPAEIRLEAFASSPATLTVMKIKRAGVRTILKQIAQRGDRSFLFHWMVEHHDEMLDRAKGGKLIWGELCVTFREHGLTNQLGQPCRSERPARPGIKYGRWLRSGGLMPNVSPPPVWLPEA